MKSLQNLVNQMRVARNAGNDDEVKSTWFQIEDAINEHPGFPPYDRGRLRNVLYSRLEDNQAGSPDIDVDEVEDYVRGNPHAGKESPKKGKVPWLRY